MYEIDIKFDYHYLNHDFERSLLYYHYLRFECKKCNILIYFCNNSNYSNSDYSLKYYYTLKELPGFYKYWKELNITCDEMIIKGIIE